MNDREIELTKRVAANEPRAYRILWALSDNVTYEAVLEALLKRGIVGNLLYEFWIECGASRVELVTRLKKDWAGVLGPKINMDSKIIS